jgi:transcription elongation GreA/GreB family factor
MQSTKMTGPMRASLGARLVDLDGRIAVLARHRQADDSLDATALHLQLSRERNQIADALADAILIDDHPFDTEAIEIGDTVTVREMESESQEQYVLVEGTVGCRARSNWLSTTSPLGASLMGRSKGDEVLAETPRGADPYLILDFERNVGVRTAPKIQHKERSLSNH